MTKLVPPTGPQRPMAPRMRATAASLATWFFLLQMRLPLEALINRRVSPLVESMCRDILRSSSWLYEKLDLRRAYYSPFRPVTGTPLEGKPAEDGKRSHRLSSFRRGHSRFEHEV